MEFSHCANGYHLEKGWFCSKGSWERKGNRSKKQVDSVAQTPLHRGLVDLLCSILMSFLFNCVSPVLKDENDEVFATSLQGCKCT